MASEEFTALNALLDARVILHFTDGQSDIGNLLNVSTDLNGSQHLIYEASGRTLYTPGEEVISYFPYSEGET